MTLEVIRDADGRLWVIDGNPNGWWFIYRVGKPAARYDTHDQAIEAIHDGDLETVS